MSGLGTAQLVFAAVLGLDLLVSAWFLLRQVIRRRREARARRVRDAVAQLVDAATEGIPWSRREARFARRRPWILLQECSRLTDMERLTEAQKKAISDFLCGARIDILLLRGLRSRSRLSRCRAASLLPLVPTRGARVALIDALEKERSRSVKLFMAAALTDLHESFAIPTMIDTLAGEPERYQRSLWGLLSEFGDDLAALFPVLTVRREKEIRFLLIHFAGRYRSPELYEYLVSRSEEKDPDISQAAFRVLCSAYPATLDHARFLRHEDRFIRNLAAEALGSVPTTRSLTLLFQHLEDLEIHRSLALAITAILRARPQHFRAVMLRCLNEKRGRSHGVLVQVLSGYVDYLMEKLLSIDSPMISQVLKEIIRHGKAQELINFLNRNTNPQIRDSGLDILQELLGEIPGLEEQLARYLAAPLLPALGIRPLAVPPPPLTRREHPNLPLLYLFLFMGAVLIPSACLALAVFAPQVSLQAGGFGVGARFLGNFNYVFTIYATTLNVLYLALLAFSMAGVSRQAARADHLRLTFLFRQHVLPSISIITPAFNEEASIVESVSSLLNLRYPDYEVIVVNDGSKDSTLQKLVTYFGLERTDLFVHRYLNTQEIRGIYANKRYPELLVVDKVNGGKADSLNAGINVARKEYFAGMDADSMLERDALLNLTGQFLYSDEQVVAAGGNIMPVNGCTVRRGTLVSTRIPRRSIGRFQTIEYLRAFMAGRVGWATVKTLLIISGAFGVFHRRSVVNAHGYLTRSEHYAKDTVGEDMELVVRLTRGLQEAHVPYEVQYAYHANCWTEIPERFKVLNRQRDRWQRGLLDIVTFHSKMIMNPAYGRTGVVGFTYFLIFEVLGPWFESEGYLVLAASLALGAIAMPMFLLLFTATVLLGLLTSTLSMIIAEHRREYFPLRDKLLLLWYAFLENFGFRQLMSLTRIRGFVRMLRSVGGWGTMERRGLGSAPQGK